MAVWRSGGVGLMEIVIFVIPVKRKKMKYFWCIAIIAILMGCSRSGRLADGATATIPEEADEGSLKDIDGNSYRTITIGDQVWMAENLRVTRFRDGRPVPEVAPAREWSKTGTGARCNYENDDGSVSIYGRLYNWYAVADPSGLAPEGWHVAMDVDWRILINALGGDLEAGKQLTGSGFRALFGGYRNIRGEYFSSGSYGFFWTATEENQNESWSWFIQSDWQGITRMENHKLYGFSVRCVKDQK